MAQSEETLRDEDAEPPEIDGHVLAKACRGKVNRLFRRMIGQCEAAVKRGKMRQPQSYRSRLCSASSGICVPGSRHFAWLPKGERLVDQDQRMGFLQRGVALPIHFQAWARGERRWLSTTDMSSTS